MKKKIKRLKKEAKINCAIMIEPSLLNEVDYYATKMGISRSLMIRNMVDASLLDLKIFDRTGALQAAKKTQNFLNILKNPSLKESGAEI